MRVPHIRGESGAQRHFLGCTHIEFGGMDGMDSLHCQGLQR